MPQRFVAMRHRMPFDAPENHVYRQDPEGALYVDYAVARHEADEDGLEHPDWERYHITRVPGRVLEVDLDDLVEVAASDEQRYEHAERMWTKYGAELDRLKPALRAEAIADRQRSSMTEDDLQRLARAASMWIDANRQPEGSQARRMFEPGAQSALYSSLRELFESGKLPGPSPQFNKPGS